MKTTAIIAAVALIAVSFATRNVKPIGSERVDTINTAYQEMVAK